MKRNLMSPPVSGGTRSKGSVTRRVTNRTHSAFPKHTRTQPASHQPSLALATTRGWMHTLVLTGELHHRSAHSLEAEIERLCDEGATGITLDLRKLTYIDSIGVAVIAFRSRLCKRRGYEFAVIPGSRLIHRALDQAGVTDLMPAQEGLASQPLNPH